MLVAMKKLVSFKSKKKKSNNEKLDCESVARPKCLIMLERMTTVRRKALAFKQK